MRLKIMVAVLMLLISALACASSETPQTPAQDISGTYDVTGTALDGSAYSGTAVLTQTSVNNYDIVWTFADQSQTGTGTFDGTTFNAEWVMEGVAEGSATYTLQADGSLVGTWTQDGSSEQGSETLTPQ